MGTWIKVLNKAGNKRMKAKEIGKDSHRKEWEKYSSFEIGTASIRESVWLQGGKSKIKCSKFGSIKVL